MGQALESSNPASRLKVEPQRLRALFIHRAVSPDFWAGGRAGPPSI